MECAQLLLGYYGLNCNVYSEQGLRPRDLNYSKDIRLLFKQMFRDIDMAFKIFADDFTSDKKLKQICQEYTHDIQELEEVFQDGSISEQLEEKEEVKER